MTRVAPVAAFALWGWLAAPAIASDGVVPSRSYSPDAVDRVISPPMGKEAHNQPSIVDGYLLLAGNASHAFWDIADPFAPELISTFLSPHHDGEAESHQIAFARHPDGRTLGVTISGRGVDLWM